MKIWALTAEFTFTQIHKPYLEKIAVVIFCAAKTMNPNASGRLKIQLLGRLKSDAGSLSACINQRL